MKYFKNVEAAALYKVSEKSVRNWIASAQAGKRDLDLFEKNGRHYIANTARNEVTIRKLAEGGMRYRNLRGRKVISPRPQFYSTYSAAQVLDIFSSLDIHREIPLQYTYFEGGAEHFDLYAKRLLNERGLNTLKATEDLMSSNFQMIDYLLKDFEQINIVDLGVGNALPVKSLLSHVLSTGKLGRYIGIDISKEMLGIAEANINSWFGDSVPTETYVKDLNYDRFGYLLANNPRDNEKAVNIVLLIGGTLSNMKHPSRVLRLINDSMNKEDIFIHSLKLDTPKARRYFNFDIQPQTQKLDRVFGTVVQLLSLEDTDYDVQQFYDDQQKCRLVCILLKYDIDLKLEVYGKTKNIHFRKGERIILFRARHAKTKEVIDQIESADFDILNVSKTFNQEFLMAISKIKNEISEAA